MANKISVIILTKDSSKYIGECLNALQRFNEIIVLDNGSQDNTLEIVKQYANVKIYTSPFIGFGPLKNLAISKASNDWILSVDSDEIFNEMLVNEILNLSLNKMMVYAIHRHNYYRHKLLNCCGWENDYVDRLFNKTNVQFNNNQVHESLMYDKGTRKEKLIYSFKHYTFDNAGELLSKMNHYSSLYAQENKAKKQSSLFKAIVHSCFLFIKNYFFQKGFMYGYEGFLIALSNANGVFYKYIKLMEANQK